jgi:hypothetical protein
MQPVIACTRSTEEAAVAALSGMLADSACPNWLYCAELLSAHKGVVDTSRVFGDWRASSDTEPHAAERHVRILVRHELPPDAGRYLRSDYEEATPGRRSDIWRLATAHSIGSFDDVACRILTTGEPRAELGLAACFVMVRTLPADVDTRVLDAAVRHADSLDLRLENWHLDRILELLLKRGRRQDATTIISRVLTEVLPRLAALRRRRREEPLQPGTSDDLELQDDVKLQMVVQGILPSAAQVADLLPRALLRTVVSADLTSMDNDAKRAYVDIVRRLRPDEIDESLAAISYPDMRAPALALVSTLGSTPRRCALLAEDLEALLRWGHTSLSAHAVDNLWCLEVAKVVVNLFARGEWVQDYGIQVHHELIDGVARRMTRELAEEIVAPAIETAAVSEARRVLQLWYDVAIHRRA